MNIPQKIASGDSVTWKDKSSYDNLRNQISAPTWTLKYAIRGEAVLNLTATTDGTGWSTTMSAAQSATLPPGIYYWQAYAQNGSDRVTLGNGKLVISQDLNASIANADLRSQSQKDLDAVQAAMRAMVAGGAVAKYVIGNRQVEKMHMTDLITLESKLKVQVAREKDADDVANGLGSSKNTYVRF
ncbi:MAG: hypothetical protein ACXWQE_00120 [Bdellovibrionales bacterium]